MGKTIQRCLGPVEHMTDGQYTVETASGLAAIRCPQCATISEISPPHVVPVGGRVSPIWSCPGCSYAEFITLESFDE